MKRPNKPVKPSPPSETILVTNEIYIYDREVNLKNVLLDAEHKGYNTSNVEIRVELDDWSSYNCSFEKIVFDFGQVETPNPKFASEMLKYEKSMALYEEKLTKYNEQLPLYTAWLNSEKNKARNKKIKELEEELAKMKG